MIPKHMTPDTSLFDEWIKWLIGLEQYVYVAFWKKYMTDLIITRPLRFAI